MLSVILFRLILKIERFFCAFSATQLLFELFLNLIDLLNKWKPLAISFALILIK
jgi:hypothetical protein